MNNIAAPRPFFNSQKPANPLPISGKTSKTAGLSAFADRPAEYAAFRVQLGSESRATGNDVFHRPQTRLRCLANFRGRVRDKIGGNEQSVKD